MQTFVLAVGLSTCLLYTSNLQAQADGKLIAYHGLLFAPAVMGEEAKRVKENITGHYL